MGLWTRNRDKPEFASVQRGIELVTGFAQKAEIFTSAIGRKL